MRNLGSCPLRTWLKFGKEYMNAVTVGEKLNKLDPDPMFECSGNKLLGTPKCSG